MYNVINWSNAVRTRLDVMVLLYCVLCTATFLYTAYNDSWLTYYPRHNYCILYPNKIEWAYLGLKSFILCVCNYYVMTKHIVLVWCCVMVCVEKQFNHGHISTTQIILNSFGLFCAYTNCCCKDKVYLLFIAGSHLGIHLGYLRLCDQHYIVLIDFIGPTYIQHPCIISMIVGVQLLSVFNAGGHLGLHFEFCKNSNKQGIIIN